MDAFVKSFSTFRTIQQVAVLSSSLVLDSLDKESSTVTVYGTSVGQQNTGEWLIIDGAVYRITLVKPQQGQTVLTLQSPLDALDRPLELSEQPAGDTVGSFVAAILQAGWILCSDAVYGIPYLSVSDSDTTAFVAPELDSTGCFTLPDYLRLMRKSSRVNAVFSAEGNTLLCKLFKAPDALHQVSFEDGRSQLQSVDYSSGGTAKLTVLQDVDTGEKDENGDKITVRQRSTWYLAEDGSISQEVPLRRAAGEWKTVKISGTQSVEEKVTETFAKNKSNHKLEFWSELDLRVQDACRFQVYGESLLSYISYKRKSSKDSRFYYKSGELATTATDKLRGAAK